MEFGAVASNLKYSILCDFNLVSVNVVEESGKKVMYTSGYKGERNKNQ